MFLPEHFFDRGFQQRHASHVCSLWDPATVQDAQHLVPERRLDLAVTGQLVQGPGQRAGDLKRQTQL